MIIKNQLNTVERNFLALGTMNKIKLFDCPKDTILDLAINRVLEIEKRMSLFFPDSDVARINQGAGVRSVTIHKDTLQVLKMGKEYARRSGGAFDMTIQPIASLWGIGKKKNHIPDERELKRALRLVNNNDLLLEEDQNGKAEAKLKHKNQAIDLGGIAKGYAAEEVKRILREEGVKKAIINLGGNIITIANPSDDWEWKIGIQNPLSETGNYVGVLSVSNQTIVTSGVNERFFIKDGIRYHHLLDPKTGFPAKTSLLSVSVVGNNSMEADAISTSIFVMGMEKGSELLYQSGMEAVFLTIDGGIYVTKGLHSSFSVPTKRYLREIPKLKMK